MSTITTINENDQITDSRTVINTNFSNLNSDKIETSYLDTDTALTANSDTKIATQKAVKSYIDNVGGANASETVRGIVEEATDAEVTSGTATGGTGAKLFVTPAKLQTRITSSSLNPVTRYYTSNDTWSKPSGLKYVVVEVIGGGGGGGGTNGASAAGGGGGAGGYSREIIAAGSLSSTETVTVGAAGTAGTPENTGGTGGTSSFGTTPYLSAAGGSGGGGSAGNGSFDGGNGGAGSNGNINFTGGNGDRGVGSIPGGGKGGVSWAGSSPGGGGNGGNGTSSAGNAGVAGAVIVTEHYI